MSNAGAIMSKRHLASAVQCAAVRMLDVISHFLLTGKWKKDLLDQWKHALQAMETENESLPIEHMSRYPPVNESSMADSRFVNVLLQ
jgi:hypothetical protein